MCTAQHHLKVDFPYAQVHHLTLFDITARGFVRPVTLAYVTKDPHKILGSFADFVRRFGEVSVHDRVCIVE